MESDDAVEIQHTHQRLEIVRRRSRCLRASRRGHERIVGIVKSTARPELQIVVRFMMPPKAVLRKQVIARDSTVRSVVDIAAIPLDVATAASAVSSGRQLS